MMAFTKNNSQYFRSIEKAYDLGAEFYDKREWMVFWKKNEMPLILKHLGSHKFDKILEVGCGTGFYAIKLLNKCNFLYGIDISKNMLRTFLRRMPSKFKNKVKVKKESILKNSLPSNFFDLTISVRTFSSIKNIDKALSEVIRVTRAGGIILISDLHPKYQIPYCVLKNPQNKFKIKMPFYRHKIEMIIKKLRQACKILEFDEISIKNVKWIPPRGVSFDEALHDLETPVFYVIKAKKL